MAKEKYVAAARVDNEKDCIIKSSGAMIAAAHRVVFGPEIKENCEKWKSSNCK